MLLLQMKMIRKRLRLWEEFDGSSMENTLHESCCYRVKKDKNAVFHFARKYAWIIILSRGSAFRLRKSHKTSLVLSTESVHIFQMEGLVSIAGSPCFEKSSLMGKSNFVVSGSICCKFGA